MRRIAEKWRKEPWRFWMTFYALGIIACGGPATGQKVPGGGTPLDPEPGPHTIGALAVQPDESNVWFVHQGTDADSRTSISFLTALDTQSWTPVDVTNVSDTWDRWLLFSSSSRALLLQENESGEHFSLLDTHARSTIAAQDYPLAHYGDPRVSPLGKFVSVVADSSGSAQIHAVDATTLQETMMMTAQWPESHMSAAWEHSHESLVAIEGAWSEQRGDASRIVRWKFDSGIPTAPDIDLTLPGLCVWPDSRNISISPDDHWAAIAFIDCPDGLDPLAIVDLNTGEYRISAAHGPVSWTPDSTTIVSHDFDDDVHPSLQLLPVGSLVPQKIAMPLGEIFDYFVTPDGNWVVCSSTFDGEIALYDAQTGVVTTVPSSAVYLSEFVSRPGSPQLWIASDLRLWSLDLPTHTLTDTGLGQVRHINVLPTHDALVLSEPQGGLLRFLDMQTAAVYRTVDVPSPVPFGPGVPSR